MKTNRISHNSQPPLEAIVPEERSLTQLAQKTRQKVADLKKNWNALTPTEIAERLVELEGEPSVQKEVEHLLFCFVHPLALETKKTVSEEGMPPSFVTTAKKVADEMEKRNSTEPLSKHFNAIQCEEVMRYAKEGA